MTSHIISCVVSYASKSFYSLQYDNVLMEEAAQILEVETFIPLMLHNPQDGYNRLKRVIMIEDHHQVSLTYCVELFSSG